MKLPQMHMTLLSTMMLLNSLMISMLLGSSHAYAQEFYKWVDNKGSTHYTTTPPPKAKGVKQKGKIDTYGLRNSPSGSATPPVNTTPQSAPNAPPPQPTGQASASPAP